MSAGTEITLPASEVTLAPTSRSMEDGPALHVKICRCALAYGHWSFSLQDVSSSLQARSLALSYYFYLCAWHAGHERPFLRSVGSSWFPQVFGVGRLGSSDVEVFGLGCTV